MGGGGWQTGTSKRHLTCRYQQRSDTIRTLGPLENTDAETQQRPTPVTLNPTTCRGQEGSAEANNAQQLIYKLWAVKVVMAGAARSNSRSALLIH